MPMVTTKVPAQTWDELLVVEPRLSNVDRLIGMLAPKWRGKTMAYYAMRDCAAALVGWSRHAHADAVHVDGVGTLAERLLVDDSECEPPNEVEAWLRSSQAYDLAVDHVIERLGLTS